jgi:hypothetical protein
MNGQIAKEFIRRDEQMKGNGFSNTFAICWILTLFSMGVALFDIRYNLNNQLMQTACVVTDAALTLLITVPLILLSMLRNSRRSADYLKAIAEGQELTAKAK